MPLKLPPIKYLDLNLLVVEYNKIPENDGTQRLFYLQKINYLLNKTPLCDELFNWIDQRGSESWEQQLLTYDINPNASFFLKDIQFAKAVVKQLKEKPQVNNSYPDEYKLMQARDNLLINSSYASCCDEYIEICFKFIEIAITDESIRNDIQLQNELLLDMAEEKFNAIKGRASEKPVLPEITYKTKELGEQGNNFNFIFTINRWPKNLVLQVPDQEDFALEQKLHSYEVAKYFNLDYAVFRTKFKDGINSVQYKPVILSQFAKQGNLEDVAKSLKNGLQRDIAPTVFSYFTRLVDFCNKLIEAGAYHPDIKLSNFLVSDNVLKVADRKSFVDEKNPFANKVRSSPFYAPKEYLDCISPHTGLFNLKAGKTQLNMPQFMAYQLGIALKEFLVLTQLDELPDNFSDLCSSASSHFKSPPRQIINLSLLVQELTRTEPDKRMSIEQFQSLLVNYNMNPDNFYNEVEKVFPSSAELQAEIKVITDVLNSELSGEEFLNQANLIFTKISDNNPDEIRLTRLAERLAMRCFKEHSHSFFAKCSKEIETLFPKQAWEKAPWYRKLLYWLSFGYYEVDKVEKLDHSTIKTSFDFHAEEFQSHLQQLQFLPLDEFKNQLGETEGTHLFDFILTQNETGPSKGTVNSNPSTAENAANASSVKENSSSIEPKQATTILVKDANHDLSKTLNSGTTVIAKPIDVEPSPDTGPLASSQPDSSQVHSQFGFFASSKASDKPVEVKSKVDSIKTTMFRNPKPLVTDILWKKTTGPKIGCGSQTIIEDSHLVSPVQ